MPLVVLAAPAGYGKSTVLAEWSTATPRQTIWLQLDERDDDPAVLLGYMAVAIDRAIGIGDDKLFATGGVGPSIWAMAVPALGSAIARAETPFLLVLDDLERLHNQESLDVIVALAAHLPAGSQMAIATRSIEGLPIPRLIAADRLVLLERDDLRLDDDEAMALLEGAGQRRPMGEVRELNAAAEGWPAGLYLTALTMRAADGGSDGATAAIPGGHRLVGEYLRTELLDRLSDHEVQFLVRTAPLERLSAPLCDHALGRSDSAHTLETLERSNLLLIPMDGERHWYRYHGLLHEFLLEEAMHQDPEAVRRSASGPRTGTRRPATSTRLSATHSRVPISIASGASCPGNRSEPSTPVAPRPFAAGTTGSRGMSRVMPTRPLPGSASMFFAFVGDPGRAERWADACVRLGGPRPRGHRRAWLVRPVRPVP